MNHQVHQTHPGRNRRRFTSAALGLLAACSLTLVGCVSADQHTFESTPLQPANVSVVSSTSNERLWRMQVPAEHDLTLNFDRSGNEHEGISVSELPADHLTWTLYNNAGTTVATGGVPLPGEPVRVQLDYRADAEVTGDGLYRIEQYNEPARMGAANTTRNDPPPRNTRTTATDPPATQPATQPTTQPATQPAGRE